MRQSPSFSDFRHLMDIWDNCCFTEDAKSKVKMLLDGNDLLMFFIKDGQLFGCPEESRMTFARIKHPNKEDPSDLKDARFIAASLYDALKGVQTRNMFGKKDMKSLKIISQEKAEKLLMKKAAGKKAKPAKVQVDQEENGQPLQQED